MDLNIRIKDEPSEDEKSDLLFENSVSDINEPKVIDSKDLEPHLLEIKVEDDPMNVSNNFQNIIILDHMIKDGELTEHMLSHNGEKNNTNISAELRERESNVKSRFSCPICNDFFVEISTFIVHWRTKHKVDGGICCPICKRGPSSTFNKIPNFSSLTVHMWEHSIEEYQNCPKVKRTKIQIKSSKSKIIKSIHETTAANTNIGVKDKREYLCPLCKISYTVLDDLIRHIDVHKKVNKYFCNVCNMQFKTDHELEDHGKTHEIEKVSPIQGKDNKNSMNTFKNNKEIKKCDSAIQSSSFSSSECATQIKSEICKEKPVNCQCPICCLYFADMTVMISHFQKSHNCPFCDRILELKTAMFDHIRSHACEKCLVGKSIHQIKSYANKCKQESDVCIVCKFKYSDKHCICACNICNMRLAKPQYLEVHVMAHSEHYKYRLINENGIKSINKEHIKMPYYCMLCQISYENSQHFLEHMREIHSYV